MTEPMTLLTDLLLGALCLCFAVRLFRRCDDEDQTSSRLFAAALVSTAVAALAGGVTHGFQPYLSATADTVLWKLTVLSIGVTSLLFLVATAVATLVGVGRRVLIGVALIEWLVYSLWMLRHDEFIWVIADYVPAMLVVLVLQVRRMRRGEREAGWIVGGIVLSLLGAGVQAAGLAPAPWFNHNDLYHVVQMVAVWLLYRGAALMRDLSGPAEASPMVR